jgi:hypothetical protein
MPELAKGAKTMLKNLALRDDPNGWDTKAAPPARLLQFLQVTHEYLADDTDLLFSAIVQAHDFCYFPNVHTDLQAQLKAFAMEHYPKFWGMVSVCRQSDNCTTYYKTYAVVEPRRTVVDDWGNTKGNDGWGKANNTAADDWNACRVQDNNGPGSGYVEDFDEWQVEGPVDYKSGPLGF